MRATKIKTILIILVFVITFLSLAVREGAYSTNDNSSSKELHLKDMKSNKVMETWKIKPGDELKITWIHSVENEPWMEFFEITEDKQLLLERIKINSLGAGVPYDYDYKMQNGNMVYKNINKIHSEYELISSKKALDNISLNDKDIDFIIDKKRAFSHIKLFVK